DRLPRAGPARRTDGDPALVLPHPRQRRTAETSAQDRSRASGFASWQEDAVLGLAGVVRADQDHAGELSGYRHAILAEQSSLHGFYGRRRNARADSRVGQERGEFGGPGGAI